MNLVLRDKKWFGFHFAWEGIIEAIKLERNLKVHLSITCIVFLLGWFVHLTLMEWVIIVLVIGFVLALELVNTAIEEIINYLKPEIHPHAKLIKDIAAGAVFIAALTAAIVGLLIFIPKLISMM